VAYTDVSRRTLHHADVPDRRTNDTDDLKREHTRAGLTLAVIWAGLAIVLGAYAIAQRSTGAVALVLVVLAVLRMAWTDSWPDDDRSRTVADRGIRLLP
jgi:hypothetical protein